MFRLKKKHWSWGSIALALSHMAYWSLYGEHILGLNYPTSVVLRLINNLALDVINNPIRVYTSSIITGVMIRRAFGSRYIDTADPENYVFKHLLLFSSL